MAKMHISGATGADAVPDSFTHAIPYFVGAKGDRRDVFVAPGEGIYLSVHGMREIERNAQEQMKDMGPDAKKSIFGNKADVYSVGFIAEDQILEWAATIEKARRMRKAANADVVAADAPPSKCHPGTDTINPELDPIHPESSNGFWLDKSRSTMHISVVSGHRFLNGSAVYHDHYVGMRLTSPDGRTLADWAMTFDQFASVMISNMSTPVTLDTYWSVEDNCVMLTEVVKEPEPIKDRMKQRLDDRLDEVKEAGKAIVARIKQQIASGKPMNKTALTELADSILSLHGRLVSNTNFVVEQALEETTQVVESAAIRIALSNNIGGVPVNGNPFLQGMVPERRQITAEVKDEKK